jgi:hypothetical protein
MITLILAAASSFGGYPITLAKMRHEFEVMIAVDDRDHDHRISRAEWDRLSDIAVSRIQDSISQANRLALKRDTAREFVREDLNRDGFLTADEMVRSRLVDFRCMDENHDGTVTKSEADQAMARCAD